MDNNAIVRFLKFLGVKLTPEDVNAVNGEAPIPGEKAPPEAPKEKPPVMNAKDFDSQVNALKLNAFPAPGGGEAPPAGATAPPEAPPAQPSNLPMLDKLITDLGGFEAFKAILLKVVEAEKPEPEAPVVPEPMQNRAMLVGKILANAKGAMSGEDLKGMDVAMLSKMLELLPADQNPVNYGALSVKINKAETPALVRPTFFFAEPKAV